MSDKTKLIMVVTADIFREWDQQRTNILLTGRKAIRLMAEIEANAVYHPRNEMEENPRFRQPIPYCLIENRENGKFVLARRETGQGEQRLHGKKYIGLGGHVDEGEDIEVAVHRELDEEFYADNCGLELPNFAGIILTYGSMVEEVHVGIFYHLLTTQQEFTNELALHSPQWATDTEIFQQHPSMELWSQVVINQYLFR